MFFVCSATLVVCRLKVEGGSQHWPCKASKTVLAGAEQVLIGRLATERAHGQVPPRRGSSLFRLGPLNLAQSSSVQMVVVREKCVSKKLLPRVGSHSTHRMSERIGGCVPACASDDGLDCAMNRYTTRIRLHSRNMSNIHAASPGLRPPPQIVSPPRCSISGKAVPDCIPGSAPARHSRSDDNQRIAQNSPPPATTSALPPQAPPTPKHIYPAGQPRQQCGKRPPTLKSCRGCRWG